MEITHEDIKHLATLSNFSLNEKDGERLKSDLQNIVKYISELDSLDCSGVEPTYQVFEMENVWRPDEIQAQEANREALLALTVATEDHQIKVPKVL